MKRTVTTRTIASTGIIAALYVAMATIMGGLSFGAIQFRIAEVLVFLPLYNKRTSWGVILGCALANIMSPLGIIDMVFGTAATGLAIIVSLKMSERIDNKLICALAHVVSNGLIIGAQLYWVFDLPFLHSALTVALGEAVVIIVGYYLTNALMSNRKFRELIEQV